MKKKKGKKAIADAATGVPNEVSKTPDKAIAAPPDTTEPVDIQDEQDRRVIVFASILFVLLAGPVVLPMEGERSLWRMTRHDDTGRAILLAIFTWPVFLGITSFVRGLRRRVPGKVLMGIATTFTSLQILAGIALVSMVLAFERKAVMSLPVWLGAFATLMTVFFLIRSFFYDGWARWQQIMVPLALLAVTVVLLMAGLEPRALERTALGGRVFLFAAAALLPFIGTTLALKKH